MILALVLQAVTAFTLFPHSLPTLFEGHFQSCNDAGDDGYGELAYERVEHGKVRWRFEMGPRDEFSLVVGSPDDHIPHDSVFNRLTPAFHYDDVQTRVGGRNWSAMGLHVNVIRVPASDDSCYAFILKIDADPFMKLARQ